MKCNTESDNEIVDAISKEYREIRQERIKLINKKLELESKLEHEKDTICYAEYLRIEKELDDILNEITHLESYSDGISRARDIVMSMVFK